MLPESRAAWDAVPDNSIVMLSIRSGSVWLYYRYHTTGRVMAGRSNDAWDCSFAREDGLLCTGSWQWEGDNDAQDFVVVARDIRRDMTDDEIKARCGIA